MSYTVLARKWRPKSFTELVGQEHVQRAIVNAIDQNRLHHAYLFTGTRGVGKTTIARIFSKCLNCESGITSAPCGTCAICQEIDGGHFVDLIEVDAASRTKVEDTREILDNVQYRPSRGRYKVYLIDEVHMLSNSSFNALLKTLEEPPPHVVFLLATTDPQKLPVTVLSRCLQFHLKRMTPQAIVAHLAHVLTAESISFDETSLQMIGQAADGSMRDALSLLDQAIAFGGGQLEQKDVADMLGAVDHQFIGDIIEHLAHQNAAGLLDVVNAMSEFSPDYQAVMSELLSTFHQMAVSKLVGENTLNNERLGKWLEQLSSEDIQLFYQLGIQARKDLPLAPDPRQGFEMALIRMLAFKPVTRATISQPNPAQSSQQPDVSAQKKTLNLDGHSIDSRTQAVDSHKQSVEHDRQRASRSRDDSTRSNRTEPSDEVNQNQSFTNNNLGSPENTLLPTEADASSSVDSPRESGPPTTALHQQKNTLEDDARAHNKPPLTETSSSTEKSPSTETPLADSSIDEKLPVNENPSNGQNIATRDEQLSATEKLLQAAAKAECSNETRVVSDSIDVEGKQEKHDDQRNLEHSVENTAENTHVDPLDAANNDDFTISRLEELNEPRVWHQWIQTLGLSGSIFQVVNNSRVKSIVDNHVILSLLPSVEHFCTDQALAKITSAISDRLNASLEDEQPSLTIKVTVEVGDESMLTPRIISEQLHQQHLQDVLQSFKGNEKVQALLNTFETDFTEQHIQLKSE